MSYYRIWHYPSSDIPYKHVYIKRDRSFESKKSKTFDAFENSAEILRRLDESERFAENVSRTKRMVTDLVLCNRFEYFCTFTFKGPGRYDLDECSRSLRRFFDNFRKRYAPDFRYLIVPEQHKDGAYHFHGLCSGFPEGELVVPEMIFRRSKITGEIETVPNTPGYLDWTRYSSRFGFFNCSPIRSYMRCAFYITKYITKETCVAKGKKAYMCSSGLVRPELVFDADDVPLIFRPA